MKNYKLREDEVHKMIDKLLDILKPFTNGSIVTTQELKSVIPNLGKNYDLEVVNDIRSATFYAFGKGKNSFKPSILLTNESGITSTYTGLTEASYQKIPVFVLVASNSKTDDFLNFCTNKQYSIRTEIDLKKFTATFLKDYEEIKHEPIVINIYEEFSSYQSNIDDNFFNSIDEFLDKDDVLCISNLGFENDISTYRYQVKTNEDAEYGIVSTYFGYALYAKNTNILVCTSKDISLDINIFNCKYISSAVKIIVYEIPGYELDIKEWIEVNGITYVSSQQTDKDMLKQIIVNDSPIVAYIKGE